MVYPRVLSQEGKRKKTLTHIETSPCCDICLLSEGHAVHQGLCLLHTVRPVGDPSRVRRRVVRGGDVAIWDGVSRPDRGGRGPQGEQRGGQESIRTHAGGGSHRLLLLLSSSSREREEDDDENTGQRFRSEGRVAGEEEGGDEVKKIGRRETKRVPAVQVVAAPRKLSFGRIHTYTWWGVSSRRHREPRKGGPA